MANDPIKSITVIIPCRNEEKYIGKCLDSILQQDYPKDKLEILVVDGMSTDGSRAIIQSYQEKYHFLKLLDNPRRIVPSALNTGIRNAKCEVIIIMGAHTEYAKDYLSQCEQVQAETGADNVGGPARTKASTYLQKAIAIAFRTPFAVGGSKSHNEDYEGEIDTVTYGCYHKAVFQKIGLFDEELVRNQDDELNFRLTRAGGKIWQSPQIKSWYYPRASIFALFRQYMQYGYWKVKVIQKHKIPASIRHIVPGMFVATLLILIPLSIISKYLRILLGLVVFSYLLANIFATLLTCRKPLRWRYLPVMPLVFFVYHFAYGYGFLRGVLDFVFLRKKASATFTKLTRAEKVDTK
ncbi:MAG: glycosyltransferase family 2 protein [Syntrophales bacterium]